MKYLIHNKLVDYDAMHLRKLFITVSVVCGLFGIMDFSEAKQINIFTHLLIS